jgi:hypothetical protein
MAGKGHGFGRSRQGIERRANASFDKRLERWVKQCLAVNEKKKQGQGTTGGTQIGPGSVRVKGGNKNDETRV